MPDYKKKKESSFANELNSLWSAMKAGPKTSFANAERAEENLQAKKAMEEREKRKRRAQMP